MADLKAPTRRIQFHLDLGADDWPEVCRVLEGIALDIERGEIPIDSSSGGWSSGHHCRSTEDAAQTGDLYRAQLEEWRMARVNAARSVALATPDGG